MSAVLSWTKAHSSPRLLNALRWIRGVIRYHSWRRFLNAARVTWATSTGKLRRLDLDPGVLQRIFYVLVDDTSGATRVVKIPRADNGYSCEFIRSIRNQDDFDRYQEILLNLGGKTGVERHAAGVLKVHRDGGYEGAFVEGWNIVVLMAAMFSEQVLPSVEREGLRRALLCLRDSLQSSAAGRRHVSGDWAPHNLVYSPGAQAVVNVDAEGFATFRSPRLENDVAWIANYIDDICAYLGLLLEDSPASRRSAAAVRVVHEVIRSEEAYRGEAFFIGYHSLEIGGREFRGQRDCKRRLSQVPFEFKDANVVDLGCNSGGMLHALAGSVRRGFGFDRDPRCINAAKCVAAVNEAGNLSFFQFDLDRDPLEGIRDLVLDEKIDICFLLSVCMWLERWREVILFASRLAEAVLFESNGTDAQQAEQLAFLHQTFGEVEILSAGSPDDQLQAARSLYLCRQRRRE